MTDPNEIKQALREAWSIDTSSKWTEECPARGQCSVTALAVQDLLGGTLLRTDVNGAMHFYNLIGGRREDFTSSQFDTPIPYDDLPATREEAMSDTTPAQYEALRRSLKAALGASSAFTTRT